MVIAGVMVVVAPSAIAGFIIDGNVDDWGIDLSAATSSGYLDDHRPSGVFSVTEDNTDAAQGWYQVGPGWSRGNYFDAEALYFTNDSTYAYVALIQGLPIEGYTLPGNPLYLPGDLAFDIGQNGSYDFGIDTSSFDLDATGKKALLYGTPSADSWNPTEVFPGRPWALDVARSGSLGYIDFMYSELQNSHYVLEARIPLALLGLSSGDSLFVHWAQQCGNDYLKLDARVRDTVMPEPLSVVLLSQGLLALAFAGRKKTKRT